MTQIFRSQASKGAELAGRKADATAEINRKIHEFRAPFITTIAGQDMIYQAKRDEAERFVALSPTPADATGYPFVEAEVGSLAATPYEVAQIYLNMNALWRSIGAMTEQIRRDAITAIESAASNADVEQAVASFSADLDSAALLFASQS